MLQDEPIWNLLIQSPFSMVDFGLESLDLHLKSLNILLLFERESLGLQDFSLLREKVLIWESESEKLLLGNNSFLLENHFSYLIGSPKMKGLGSIYRENPPLHLRSNFDLDLPLHLYWGLNLVWLDLNPNVNF